MTKNGKRVLTLLATLVTSTTLLATIDNQKEFLAKYPDAKAKLGKCSTCHEKALPKKEDFKVNPYGKACKEATGADKKIDFAKIEAADSDGDGVKNLDEIKAGTNPGDAKSK